MVPDRDAIHDERWHDLHPCIEVSDAFGVRSLDALTAQRSTGCTAKGRQG